MNVKLILLLNLKNMNKRIISWYTLRKTLITLCVSFCTLSLFAQQSTPVLGVITDAEGLPVAGVGILVKGTNIGVASDDNGKYSINVPNGNAVLVYSLLGYATQEITVGSQTVINVTLSDDAQSIDEVVVIGYGSVKKTTLTGAVASIGSTDLMKTKSGNVQNALVGRLPGVMLNQRSSQPGTFNSDFNIRGMGTPLVVIDGVPRDNMTRMDANEIESISVLKDASAAIYGSRAANGVVLITTKKGREKKFAFEYNGYVGVQNMLLNATVMNAPEYMRILNEKAANSGNVNLPYSAAEIAAYENGTKTGTDWLDAVAKKSPMVQQHSFSASGSTKKVDYYTNFGYYHQDGWFKSDGLFYNKFNLRSNVTAHLTDRLKADVFLNLITDQRHQQPENTWRVFNRGIQRASPLEPVYVDGDPNYPFNVTTGNNPVALSDPNIDGYNFNNERAIQTNLSLEYDLPFVKGLKAKGLYSYDYIENDTKIFRRGYTLYNYDKQPSGGNGWNPLRRVWAGHKNTLLQLSLVYNKTINDVHNIGGTLVYEESDREGDNFWAERHTVMKSVDQFFAATTTGQATGQEQGRINPREDSDNAVRDGLYHYANKALIGRFTYDYDEKYMLDFSFRYDGSSRFGPGHQWGFFPTVQGAWNLAKESFIKDNLSLINSLKLKASWGQMGDEGNSTYQFLTGYNYGNNGNYVFGTDWTAAAVSRGIPNTQITWTTSTVTNIGLEAEFWNGLLGVTADIYKRDQTGLLSTRIESLPAVVGANLPQENLNSSQTHGFEFALSHRNKIGQVNYTLTGGIFMHRTKDKYVEQTAAIDSWDNWRGKSSDRWRNIMWGIDYAGQYQNFDQIFDGAVYDQGNAWLLPGDLILEDWNGDGVIDDNDRHPISINANYGDGVKPLLNYNFSIGLDYKGFDLNILLQGAGMAWRTFGDEYRAVGINSQNGFNEFYDRWHRADEMNPSKWQEWIPGKYPSVYWGLNGRGINNAYDNSFWIKNTAYLRLKSIELGYTIPQSITQKIKIDKVRVYFNSFNALTFTSMTIGDPEVADQNEYPLNRTFSFGLNVNF
jgi:TonB-linked SusC/RagA family outer membrane protein